MNCLARTFHFQGISAAEINILPQIRIIENVIMKIEHVAIWTTDLVTLRDFYVHYFNAVAGDRYVNPRTRFESYFLSFKEGARLELMTKPDLTADTPNSIATGYAHIAISAGSKQRVNSLTEQLRSDGYVIVSEPRTTGDGYYESVVLDPGGNHVEITE